MNQSTHLHIGTRFTLSSFEQEICWVGLDSFRCMPTSGGGAERTYPIETFNDLLKKGDIVITHLSVPAANSPMSLSFMTDRQRAAFYQNLKLVKLIVDFEKDFPCSQNRIKKFRHEYIAKHPEQNVPGSSVLASLVSRWLRSGRSDESLIPQPRASKAHRHELPFEVEKMMAESIRSVYMTKQRKKATAIRADLSMKIASHNKAHLTSFEVPSQSTIDRRIRRIDAFARDLTRYGAHFARRKHRAAGRSFYTDGPLDCAMADGHYMDIQIVNHKKEVVGRPYMTAVIDVRTRCILAVYISMAPFSGATLLAAMKTAVVAKPGYPRGIPARIVVDNGADYKHKGFVSFCNHAGTSIEPCSPRSPNQKAIIERFFLTLNKGLIHQLPGTTFSNVSDRGDYESQKYASVTLDQLRTVVDEWIHSIYHTETHDGIGMAPLSLWNLETAS